MINLPLPDSLDRYQNLLEEFFAGMLHKLHLNSHKDTPAREQIEGIIALLRREIEEFEEQLAEDKFDPNSLVELFDTANFAFLAFVAMRLDGVTLGEKA